MNCERMVTAMTEAIKQKVTDFCGGRDFSRLTPAVAEEMAQGLTQAVAAAGVAGYRSFLEAYEVHESVLGVGGEVYRLKGTVEKCFLTPFGLMVLGRRLFQNKADTQSYVPLDAAWGMEDAFMTPEVREAALFSCAHVTPQETETLLKKAALFHPSATAIKHELAKTGAQLAAHKEAVDARVRAQEAAPPETRVLVGSLDGANVLLDEPGVKRGRPCVRPTGEPARPRPTAYKNAMVGSISFYGAVPEGERTPERLVSRYTARMPEDAAPTFKAHFEAELRDAQAKCSPAVIRLLLLDGARPLWHYAENTPYFDDWEKLIDYTHTVEHLSKAAEALFGARARAKQRWYDTYRVVLLEDDAGATRVLRSIDYYAATHRRGATARAALETQRTFFARNKHRMNYAAFRRRGLPIGSGPVEAACKTLVKARLCRSGMRWSREGGQHVLDLRAYVKSNRWDAAWQEIKRLPKAA